ncbi:hypothetical protein C4D60_Mb09t10660 [Musa balbisiana]|uniref:Uncharacterized protein n=1 Tax=Musa balbisiana TaxID=52838 RepID=A0A4S8IFF1_MUSBA|nr:hypothetical protein C4D60_Mb09t10660 [Musa balbisiana]
MRTCRCRGQRGAVLVSSDSCRRGTGLKGSSDAIGEVDAFRALHIVPLLHDCGWIRRGRSRIKEGENEAERTTST